MALKKALISLQTNTPAAGHEAGAQGTLSRWGTGKATMQSATASSINAPYTSCPLPRPTYPHAFPHASPCSPSCTPSCSPHVFYHAIHMHTSFSSSHALLCTSLAPPHALPHPLPHAPLLRFLVHLTIPSAMHSPVHLSHAPPRTAPYTHLHLCAHRPCTPLRTFRRSSQAEGAWVLPGSGLGHSMHSAHSRQHSRHSSLSLSSSLHLPAEPFQLPACWDEVG